MLWEPRMGPQSRVDSGLRQRKGEPWSDPSRGCAELCRYPLRKPEAWESAVGFLAPGPPLARGSYIRVQKLRGGTGHQGREEKRTSWSQHRPARGHRVSAQVQRPLLWKRWADPSQEQLWGSALTSCLLSLSCSCLAGWAPGQMPPKGRMPVPHWGATALAANARAQEAGPPQWL